MKRSEFDEMLKTQNISVIYFSHDACNVCKVLKPKVRELVAAYANATFQYVNTRESQELCGQLLIFAVPTVVIFFQEKEVKRFSRNFSVAEVETILARFSEFF